eukprot:NODE_5249_length_318_cov_320.765799_g4638_i0.p1 GENE.NODE_5249_length_318_cov_320.765799_g4638_i0~~NODE_5249_length_318_cov_320.765799_g4638_i0.p1  ORF type:complete len:96 (-),score=28.12 NODE_5249_length_318_cov_320.765799_g4638_i0:4-291(-)
MGAGTFGCSNFSYMPLKDSAKNVVDKLNGYFEWAKKDTRIAGFNPWHFNYRDHPNHPPPCDMQLGANDLPGVVDVLRSIGHYIKKKKKKKKKTLR